MTIHLDKQIPGSNKPWYTPEDMRNRNRILSLIMRYFPDITNTHNDVDTALRLSPNLQIVNFPNEADANTPLCIVGGEYRLVYRIKDFGVDNVWALQFTRFTNTRRNQPDLQIQWGGLLGYKSKYTAVDFVKRINFQYEPDNSLFHINLVNGYWSRTTNIGNAKLRELLEETSNKFHSQTILKNFNLRYNFAEIQYTEGQETKSWVFPSTVKPTRFV